MNPAIDNFVVLRAKRNPRGDYTLLCHLPENKATPWVTWTAASVDGKDRMKGNYFFPEEETAAYEDYDARW